MVASWRLKIAVCMIQVTPNKPENFLSGAHTHAFSHTRNARAPTRANARTHMQSRARERAHIRIRMIGDVMMSEELGNRFGVVPFTIYRNSGPRSLQRYSVIVGVGDRLCRRHDRLATVDASNFCPLPETIR